MYLQRYLRLIYEKVFSGYNIFCSGYKCSLNKVIRLAIPTEIIQFFEGAYIRAMHRLIDHGCVKRAGHSMGFRIRYRSSIHVETSIRIGLLLGSVLQQSSGLLHSEMEL